MADLTPEPIFQLASGFMAAKHLFIANEIGLFTALADGTAPLDSLAELTGIVRPRVRILADALVTWDSSSAMGTSIGTGRWPLPSSAARDRPIFARSSGFGTISVTRCGSSWKTPSGLAKGSKG